MSKEEVMDIIKNYKTNYYKKIKQKDENFYNEIDKMEGAYFSERLYRWLHFGLENMGICLECGKFTIFNGMSRGYRTFCSPDCVKKSKIVNVRRVEKIKETNQKKYGVDNVFQTDWFRDKAKQHNLSRYGVENVSQSKEIKQKKEDDFMRRYGVKCAFNLPWVKEKAKINLDRRIHSSTEMSMLQRFISEYIKSKGIEIEENTRIIIDGELDIYIPERKIAIECNGAYWHSIDKKDKNYHLNKTIQCEYLGIKLIHLFDTDWFDKGKESKQLVDNILNNEPINTIIEEYKTEEGGYIVDRRFYNKCFFNANYRIIEETEPIQCKFENVMVWNCGYLKMYEM